ncbi:hypothetical protein GXP67_22235 [Rhodocytophaga rosea]|uniref:Uncharacterized protein n=1 Tax=Rhodocytophaga rosea TaxID=2704465 RepID=A0A6C0GMU2_9BACT|nr:hypothetical protein [Rhodocytophaga rosea]QHT69164.1 hypothetical protein GXP67_22235 [Rhodocytophaga rosea]
MKKLFFFKEYTYYSEFESKTSHYVATVEVDYDEIEKELPSGARIKYETVQTMIEAGKFIVYGEYTFSDVLPNAISATESIDISQVLGEEGILPSAN